MSATLTGAVTRGDYWQSRSNGGWQLDGSSYEEIKVYTDYDEYIQFTQNLPHPLLVVIPPRTTAFWLDAMIAAKWKQEAPYNNKVPKFLPSLLGTSKNRCRIGCAPIAMGQIMSHHRHPANYDWSAINSSPSISANAPAFITNAVSTLLYDIAIEAKTRWNTQKNVGSTYSIDIVPTLNAFGYNATVTSIPVGSTISAEIYDDLMAGRPVLLAGQGVNPEGGIDSHIWVVDGLFREYGWYYSIMTLRDYDFISATLYRYQAFRSMIHCNWGWGDDSNGWYASMTPYYAKSERTVDLNSNLILWRDIRPC